MYAIEDLLLQSLDMKRALDERLTIVEATVTKANKAEKGLIMDDYVLKAVLKTTKK